MLPAGRSVGEVAHGADACLADRGAALSLQRRLAAAGGFLGELDLGDRDQDLGAGLEVRRLEQRLLLGRRRRATSWRAR